MESYHWKIGLGRWVVLSSYQGRAELSYNSAPEGYGAVPGMGFWSKRQRLAPQHQRLMRYWWPPIEATRSDDNAFWRVGIIYPALALLFAIVPASLALRFWWRRRKKLVGFPIAQKQDPST